MKQTQTMNDSLENFHLRAKTALEHLMTQPELRDRVKEGVDVFFAKYPALARTSETKGFIASLVINRLGENPVLQTQTK